jgi:hypothetical protein
MRKWILIFLLFILGCLAGWVWHAYHQARKGVEGEAPSSRLTADSLCRQYLGDENKANTLFLGKVVEVSGRISEITRTIGGGTIQLRCSEMGAGISCNFSGIGREGLPDLKKGDLVVIKGRCTGFLADVNLVDCKLSITNPGK